MLDVARAALAQMPPETRFNGSDAQIIARHREALLTLEPALVKSFYDTLYTHPPTRAVLGEDPREAREQTLVGWWRRTVEGPLDEAYFAWMAMVGLVHVNRRVSNAMMLSMAGFVCSTVTEAVSTMDLEDTAAAELVEAFGRFTSTVGALVSFGYDRATDRAVKTALFELAGMPESLFQRLHDQEIVTALQEARAGQSG